MIAKRLGWVVVPAVLTTVLIVTVASSETKATRDSERLNGAAAQTDDTVSPATDRGTTDAPAEWEVLVCPPGSEADAIADTIAGSVVEAMGPNTPEEALVAAGLFGGEMADAILSGEADVRTEGSDSDRRLVLYVSGLSRQPQARVVVDLFDDTWMMTSAELCVVHEAGNDRP